MTRVLATVLSGVLLTVVLLPVVGLIARSALPEVLSVLQRPSTQAALWLTGWTTALSLVVVVVSGTPLAWWLSRGDDRLRRLIRLAVALPVVLPPAVLGVALLETFGRQGLLGGLLSLWGVSLPFSPAAVILAQVTVSAPLFVLPAAGAFRAVDGDLLLVARTLGAGPARAWSTVALPAASGGLLAGMALAWGRALGEFGATLMFAGNLPGRTQTLTLAVFQALEQDLTQARSLSVLLVGLAALLLFLSRGAR